MQILVLFASTFHRATPCRDFFPLSERRVLKSKRAIGKRSRRLSRFRPIVDSEARNVCFVGFVLHPIHTPDAYTLYVSKRFIIYKVRIK